MNNEFENMKTHIFYKNKFQVFILACIVIIIFRIHRFILKGIHIKDYFDTFYVLHVLSQF